MGSNPTSSANRVKRVQSEFLRYLVAGVVNTFVGYAVFLAALHGLGLGVFASNALSYATGLTAAYLQNRYFVFRGARHSSAALLRFLAGFGVAYLVNLAVLELAHARLGLRAEWAQLFAMVAYTVSFYLINRCYVWRVAR